MGTSLKTIKELQALFKDSPYSSPLKTPLIMIVGRASNVFTHSDPESVDFNKRGRDIYLFFDIQDETGEKTHIACCENYQPNHRFLSFRENQDLEVFIPPKAIKMLGQPNVFGALTVREKKGYHQTPKHYGESLEMTMKNLEQSTGTSGGISSNYSSQKDVFTSTKRDFENEDVERRNSEICKNLHLEYFISENDNRITGRQEDQFSARSDVQPSQKNRDWSLSLIHESEEEEEGSLQFEIEEKKNTGYNFEMLKAKILSMSESQEWDSAKEEWRFIQLHKKPDGTCPCGHHPITNHCVIQNQENGNKMFLGNCCIRHISKAQHKRAQKIWQIFRNPKTRANQDLIDHAFSQGYISQDEKNLYESLPRRKRTPNQNKLMLTLNLKIIGNWDAKLTECGINPSHIIEIHYDQALYYKCTECEFKVKFHEIKEKILEDEGKMEEEFESLFGDDMISSESSSDENAAQDEDFVPSQRSSEEEEEDSENEDSVTTEIIDAKDEDYILIESDTQEGEAFLTRDLLQNQHNHSNQQPDKFTYGEDGEAIY